VAAAAWIAKDSPAAARRLIAAADRARRLIAEQPQIGRVRPDVTPLPVRFLPLVDFPYVVVYRPEGAIIRIIRVIHASRDLEAALRSG
jgi:plasmid stabilization system protein ParE